MKVTREAAWCASGAPRLREASRGARLREAATEPDGSAPAGSAAGPKARRLRTRPTPYSRRFDSVFPFADSQGEGGGERPILTLAAGLRSAGASRSRAPRDASRRPLPQAAGRFPQVAEGDRFPPQRSPQLNTIPRQFSQISLHLRQTSAVLPQ